MSSTTDAGRRDRACSLAGHLLDGVRSRPLPPAEQQRLACAFRQTRDPQLEHQLIEANLRLVVKIARDLDRTHGRQLEDLVQEGTLGLIQAIRRFDPAHGANLAVYAGYWIRAFVMKYIMDNVRVLRVVRTRAERADFFRGVVDATEVSLEARGPRDSAPLTEQLADPARGIDEVVETAELVHRLRQEAARLEHRLSGRDAIVLRERLLAEQPKPCRLVGKHLSLSAERVRQIEVELRAALKGSLEVAHAA